MTACPFGQITMMCRQPASVDVGPCELPNQPRRSTGPCEHENVMYGPVSGHDDPRADAGGRQHAGQQGLEQLGLLGG
jgi:hypothetical protein